MEIIKISELNKEDYEKLAKNEGNLFNTLEWLNMFNSLIEIYGIFNKGNNLIGGFHLYKQKKLGLTIYRNPPFTPSVGPFLNIIAKNPVKIMDTWKKVLSTIADFTEDLPYSIIFLKLGRDVIDTQPFIWKNFKVIPGYTYILDLNKSLDELNKSMSSERRNDINKGIKDKLVVKKVDDLKIVKLLVLETFSRQEKTVNEYYLDKILFRFANERNSFAFVTFENDKPIAATFCVHDQNTAYYLLGGYDHKNKHHGAGAISIWSSIENAKKLGLRYFDFEGSMIPQIESYFRGFGGKLTPYYRVIKAKLPLELILKFYKRELF